MNEIRAIAVKITIEGQDGTRSRHVEEITRQINLKPGQSWRGAIEEVVGGAQRDAIRLMAPGLAEVS